MYLVMSSTDRVHLNWAHIKDSSQQAARLAWCNPLAAHPPCGWGVMWSLCGRRHIHIIISHGPRHTSGLHQHFAITPHIIIIIGHAPPC